MCIDYQFYLNLPFVNRFIHGDEMKEAAKRVGCPSRRYSEMENTEYSELSLFRKNALMGVLYPSSRMADVHKLTLVDFYNNGKTQISKDKCLSFMMFDFDESKIIGSKYHDLIVDSKFPFYFQPVISARFESKDTSTERFRKKRAGLLVHYKSAVDIYNTLVDYALREVDDNMTDHDFYIEMDTFVDERRKDHPEAVIFARKDLIGRTEVKRKGHDCYLSFEVTGSGASVGRIKVEGVSIERLGENDCVRFECKLFDSKEIMLADFDEAFDVASDNKVNPEYLMVSKVINDENETFNHFMLKRVLAFVIAEFAGRIHRHAKSNSDKGAIDKVMMYKLLIAIRKRVKELLTDISDLLDVDDVVLLHA